MTYLYYNITMATLNEIELLLNIELCDRVLRNGKRKDNKNQYYYFREQYYIVKLTRNKWMIIDDCRKSRKMLIKHTWYYGNHGYAMTNIDNTRKSYHQCSLNYEKPNVADHINNKRFDNRFDNLRIVTPKENSRNTTKQINNTSGKQGVCHFTDKRRVLHYWKAYIKDNNSKRIEKYFSIKKLGDAEAFRQAVEKRKELEILYGYIGD
jgi:hypothetical protein